MTVDSSTLSTFLLLVFVASLGSYVLYQWSQQRGAALLALGSSLLLAAVVVIVTFVSLQTVRTQTDMADNPEPRAIGAFPSSGRQEIHPAAPSESAPVSSAPQREHRASSDAIARIDPPQNSSTRASSGTLNHPPPSAAARTPDVSDTVRLTLTPWAATTCVYAIQPDPADSSRWWLENECNAPVAVLTAACNQSAEQCNDLRSTAWRYAQRPMTLPSKSARSVTFEEQTLSGRNIRYIACVITDRAAMTRVNADAGSMPDRSVEADACLDRVESTLARFGTTGLSIDALPGRSAPGVSRWSDVNRSQ